MIIHLKELTERYKISISDLSKATGIARSTLTPLIKSPSEIENVRLKTIDTLCDFFGVSISTLLEFNPTEFSERYTINSLWIAAVSSTAYIILIRKLGEKERAVALEMRMSFGANDDGPRISILINALSTEAAKQRIPEPIENNIDGSLFYSDLLSRKKDDLKQVTKLLIQSVFLTSGNPFPEYKSLISETKQFFAEWSPNDSDILIDKRLKFVLDQNNELHFDCFETPYIKPSDLQPMKNNTN